MNETRAGSIGRFLIPGVIIAALLYFLSHVHHVLLPFVLAATLAYLLNPLVVFFEVRGVRREAAVIGVFFSFLTLVFVTIYFTITITSEQISRMSSDIPLLLDKLQNAGQAIAARYPAVGEWAAESGLLKKTGDPHSWIAHLLAHTPTVALHVLPIFELTFLVPFLAFLFMMDGRSLRDAVLEFVPAGYVEMALNVFVEIDNSLGNYLRGLLIQAVFMGVLSGIGFSIIGLNYAAPIGMWVAATAMVPLIGAISAAVAGGLVAIVQWGTFGGLMKVLIIGTAIRLIDDWFLQPYILRKAVHIHPALTVFSLMAGASLFGFWGLLFAVPVVCMVKVLLEVVLEWYRSEYGLRYVGTPAEVSHIPLI